MNGIPEIVQIWKLSSGIVIAEIQHAQNGLPAETVIENEGERWKIVHRMVFSHVGEQHQKFENETTQISILSFKSTEARESSRKNILDKEQEGIFQYSLRSAY